MTTKTLLKSLRQTASVQILKHPQCFFNDSVWCHRTPCPIIHKIHVQCRHMGAHNQDKSDKEGRKAAVTKDIKHFLLQKKFPFNATWGWKHKEELLKLMLVLKIQTEINELNWKNMNIFRVGMESVETLGYGSLFQLWVLEQQKCSCWTAGVHTKRDVWLPSHTHTDEGGAEELNVVWVLLADLDQFVRAALSSEEQFHLRDLCGN